jgi:hypothetical protein
MHWTMMDYPEATLLKHPDFAFKMRPEENKPWQK